MTDPFVSNSRERASVRCQTVAAGGDGLNRACLGTYAETCSILTYLLD